MWTAVRMWVGCATQEPPAPVLVSELPPNLPADPVEGAPVEALPPELAGLPRDWVEVKRVSGAWVRWDGYCDARAEALQVREGPVRLELTWGKEVEELAVMAVEPRDDGARFVLGQGDSVLHWVDREAGVASLAVGTGMMRGLMPREQAAALPGMEEPGCPERGQAP